MTLTRFLICSHKNLVPLLWIVTFTTTGFMACGPSSSKEDSGDDSSSTATSGATNGDGDDSLGGKGSEGGASGTSDTHSSGDGGNSDSTGASGDGDSGGGSGSGGKSGGGETGGASGSGGSTGPAEPLPPHPDWMALDPVDTSFDESTCAVAKTREENSVVQLAADIIDLQGIECIIGNLNVAPTTLLDLSGLESLKYVSGNLVITSSPSLNSLIGLGGLMHVGGNFQITSTKTLVSTTGLSSLAIIGGSLEIRNNAVFSRTTDLGALKRIGGDIRIENNTQFGGFANGMSVLTEVGGTIVIKNSPALLSTPELAGIQRVGGIEISGNIGLGKIDLSSIRVIEGTALLANQATESIDLGSLEWVQENFQVTWQPSSVATLALSSLDLSSLVWVEGEMGLVGGDSLLAVDLPELKFVDSDLAFGAFNAVLELKTPQLAQVGGGLYLGSMSRLRQIDFPKLIEVGAVLSIRNSDRLGSASFPALQVVGDEVSIGDLDLLKTVDLSALTSATDIIVKNVGHESGLEEVNTDSLKSLSGGYSVSESEGEPVFRASNLSQVGSFTFEYNGFSNIEGFTALQAVDEDFVIKGNNNLFEVSGFGQLATIGDSVWFLQNPGVESATGIETIRSAAVGFTVESNGSLAELDLALESAPNFRIWKNTRLKRVTASKLKTVSDFAIQQENRLSCLLVPALTDLGGSEPAFVVSDTALATCLVDEIKAQITTSDVRYLNASNSSSATCPVAGCP